MSAGNKRPSSSRPLSFNALRQPASLPSPSTYHQLMANQSTRTHHATSILPQVDSQDDDPDITTSSHKRQHRPTSLPRPYSTCTHLLVGLLFLCVTATQTLAFPAAEDPARATHVFDVVASPAGTVRPLPSLCSRTIS